MGLLVASTLCSRTIATASEIIYVPEGYTTIEDGYFMPEQDGRDVLEAWTIDREQKEYYKDQLDKVLDKQAETYTLLLNKIEKLEIETKNLVAEKDRQIRVEKAKAKRPGWGVFTGVAYTHDSEVRLVVGFGLVWKPF